MSNPGHTCYPKYEFKRALTYSSTDADFATNVPTLTMPATIDEADASANKYVGKCTGSKLKIIPFGTDTDNDQLSMFVTLWKRIRGTTATNGMWMPYRVGGFELTLCSMTGAAGGVVSETEFFVDTITEIATATWDDTIVSVLSRTDNFPGMIKIDPIGFELFQVDFDMNVAGGTDGVACNFIYASY